MSQIKTQIHKLVMRRVWYVFLLSLFVNRNTVAGFIFGISLGAFVQLVSVRSILANLAHTEVGQVPTYVWQSLTSSLINGELMQVVFLGLIVASLGYLVQVLRTVSVGGRREWGSV